MAYREYIGSRYVPIFGRKGEDTTEWDNLAPYEPLTVVTYQGNSYISRQYVPTGIEITNTDYWVSTGVYNAQVEAYRQEVLTFDGRITANSDAIGDINTELDQFEETTNGNFTAVNDRVDDLNTAVNDRIDVTDKITNVVIARDGLKKENTLARGSIGGIAYLDGYLYCVTNFSSNTGHDLVKMDLEGNVVSTEEITDIFASTYHVNQLSTLDGTLAIQTSGTLIKFVNPANRNVVKTMPVYSSSRAFNFFNTSNGAKYAAFMSDNPINPYEVFFYDPVTDIYVKTDISIGNNDLFFGTLEQAMHVDFPLVINMQSYQDATFCDTINIRCGGRKSGSIYFPEIEEEIEGITTDATYLYLIGGSSSLYRYRKSDLFRNMMYDWYKESAMTPYNIVGCGLRHSKGTIDYIMPFEQSGRMKVVTPLVWTQAIEKGSSILIYGVGGDNRPNLLGRADFGGASPDTHAGFLNQGRHFPVIPIYILADSHVQNAPVTIITKEENGNTEFTDTNAFLTYINDKWSTNYSKLGLFLTMDESYKFSVAGFE